MTKFEKQIYDAATIACVESNKFLSEEPLTADVQWDVLDFSVGFKYGVFSDIAKKHHQEGMFSLDDMKKAFIHGCETCYDDHDGRYNLSEKTLDKWFKNFLNELSK